MGIKKIKMDTRGASLIYVVIVASIIILIGSIATAAAYANLRSAKLNEAANENFYRTSNVANIILCGLQDDVVDAYWKACEDVSIYTNDADALHNFQFMFLDEFDKIINNGKSTNCATYDIGRLHKYVQEIMPDNLCYTITALNGDNVIVKIDDGIVLRNVHITYEDDYGYFDEMTVDFKITIPPLQIRPQLEDLVLNSFIAGGGLQINDDVSASIDGKLYFGHNKSDGQSIVMGSSAFVDIKSDELVSSGLVSVGSGSALHIVGQNIASNSNKLWVDGFSFDANSTINIDGQLYMAGNMNVFGDNVSVSLIGKYVGFGKTSDMSSGGAINDGGYSVNVDTSGLTAFVSIQDAHVNGGVMNKFFAQIRNQYYGDGIRTGKINEMSYNNVINADKLAALITHVINTKQYGDASLDYDIQIINNNAVVIRDRSGAVVILVDNAGEGTYEIGSGAGLIVASGDIVITGSWDGAIITNGRIFCGKDGGASQTVKLTANDIDVAKVLRLVCSYDMDGSRHSMGVVNVFVGYEAFDASANIDVPIDNYVSVVGVKTY